MWTWAADGAAPRARWGPLADARGLEGRTLAGVEAKVVRAAAVAALGLPVAAFRRLGVPPLTVTELSGRARRWNLRLGRPLSAPGAEQPPAERRSGGDGPGPAGGRRESVRGRLLRESASPLGGAQDGGPDSRAPRTPWRDRAG
ncbi:hypothetical protein GCM10010300_37590 [Streptomyces olivaceoviridis]|nr:hypothetical protein GCM10010300_37590 [Streptomyces olivaceoviridis]